MKILFHLGHPAHYHLFKNSIKELKDSHKIFVLIKKKDILEKLLIEENIPYLNILPNGRKDSKIGIGIGLLKSNYEIFRFCLNNTPDILVGTSPNITHVGKLLNIPSINFNEDDAAVVPLYVKLTYPFSSEILTPISCDNGKWNNKSIKYNSYHELAYLHPRNFTPDKNIANRWADLSRPYFIIRFAKLGAHHDEGIKGISDKIAIKLIKFLTPYGRVYITSERKLSKNLEPYRISIEPIDMHHVMAFASLYIGDSQTMAAESAVLGIPFIRFNDFVGRIGYLNELENTYKLGYGIKTNNVELLYRKVEELLNMTNRNTIFQERRERMLSEKIDFASFLIWFIENYPQSAKIMKENPDYQYRFK